MVLSLLMLSQRLVNPARLGEVRVEDCGLKCLITGSPSNNPFKLVVPASGDT